MLEGIIYSAIYKENNSSNASTTAWLSFLLCALAFVAYILGKYLIVDDTEYKTTENNNAARQPSVNVKSASNHIVLLKQYKEMLDQGIISQEEFDAKKKELL